MRCGEICSERLGFWPNAEPAFVSIAVNIPGPPYGDAKTLDEAKQRFKAAWIAFNDKHGSEKLAKVFAEMYHANRPDRYRH